MTRLLLLLVVAVGCESGIHPVPPEAGCVIERIEDGEVVVRSIDDYSDGVRRVVTVERPALPGAQPQRFDFEYDGEGRLVAVEMNQGSITTRREATYEDDRIVVRYSERESIEYVLEGGRIVLERGPVADGRERTVRYAYDAEGRVVEIEDNDVDPDTLEPRRTVRRVLSFDGQGRITGAEYTSSYGSMPETTALLEWTYEPLMDGVVVTRTARGRATSARFHADTTGRLLSASADEDGDGTFDWVATYAYADAARTMVATSERPGMRTELGFEARGVCEPPRLPALRLEPPVPIAAVEGVVHVTIPGHDILGL